MLHVELPNRFETQRRSRAALLVSLGVHLVTGLILAILLMLKTEIYPPDDALDVEWIKLKDETPKRIKRRIKTPVEPKVEDKEKPVAREEPDKEMKQANNPITEVVRFSPRILFQNAENVIAPKSIQLPDVTTIANLPTDVTSLSAPRSLPGQTDGIGKVTGQARVQGSGLGSMLFNNSGTGDGLLGGGGKSGTKDPLKIIDFLKGRGEQGRIVYVLDVSASMRALGLYKLPLAKQSLIDHVFLLNENDEFNILTFSGSVAKMSGSLMPATSENLSRARQYLTKFTEDSIENNMGTNTLAAIETALSLKPNVIVLLTDGVPTSAGGTVVETDPDRIIRAVKAKNTSQAVLFIVGLEIDIKDSPDAPGALLLKRLAEQTGGRIKFVSRDELIRYREQTESAQLPKR